MTNEVNVFGDGGGGGTYALRLKATKPIQINIGTQEDFENTPMAGEMIYLGSARGKKGGNWLRNRLHRHATRTGKKRPQKIRVAIRKALFEDKHWRTLKDEKKKGWGIDDVIDNPYVVFQSVYALQHPQKMNVEHALAIRLNGDAQTHVIEDGLGAQDWTDGFDHLLSVTADDVWWRLLAVRMEALASESEDGAHATDLVESYLRGHECLKRLGPGNYQRITFAKGSDVRRVVEAFVESLAETERERPAKLKRMKKKKELKIKELNKELKIKLEQEQNKKVKGKDSGTIRLYPFPTITDALIISDIKLAMAVEKLRKNCGDRALDVIFSLKRCQSRSSIERLSRTPIKHQKQRVEGLIQGRFSSLATIQLNGDLPREEADSFSR